MNIKRRDFLGFFLTGGLVSLVEKQLRPKKDRPLRTSRYREQAGGTEKEAMFWRRKV